MNLRNLFYWAAEPPLWIQDLLLNLATDNTNLDLWIAFATFVWVLLWLAAAVALVLWAIFL